MRAALRITLMFAALVLTAKSGLAAYRLSPGDTLEFTAAGAADLKHRTTIGIDGDISLPLIGPIAAKGLTLAELRAQIQAAFTQRVYRRSGPDGREQPLILSPDEITITIAEYRPVVLNGDVSKPGEQPFRPAMTVRQAVAAAGGYDFVRFRMNNPFLEQADLKSSYEALWIEFAKAEALKSRLEAELSQQNPKNGRAPPEDRLATPLPDALTRSFEEREEKQLILRNALHASEKDFLDRSIAKEEARISVLTKQQSNERAGADADADEVSRLEGLYAKGAVPITRVVDARRTMLLSSTRFLQTISEQARMERERDGMAHKLAQLDDRRRLDLLHDIQDTDATLAVTRSKLQTAGEKLAYAGMLRSQLVSGSNAEPAITIYRNEDGKAAAVTATENTELMPGDVIEVALKQFLPETTARAGDRAAKTP